MLDLDTFLLELYVIVDDFGKGQPPEGRRPGPAPALSRSEVIALALLSRWARFPTERAFARFARAHLRRAFPTLPERSQLNRLIRAQHATLATFAVELARWLGAEGAAYEVADGTGVAVRDVKRRGWGWLDGLVGIGWSNHLGWYEGFHLLLAVTPTGVITGFGFGPGGTNERARADTLLAARHAPAPSLPGVGRAAGSLLYLLDKGFGGRHWRRRWRALYAVEALAPPERNHPNPWPRAWRRLHASLRQIVETVNEKLHHAFRLASERPHALDGFQAHLAASVALHNVCIWLNRQHGRPDLQFADLIAW
jgi:hypothetical protein